MSPDTHFHAFQPATHFHALAAASGGLAAPVLLVIFLAVLAVASLAVLRLRGTAG
jgi:hypothetical protein